MNTMNKKSESNTNKIFIQVIAGVLIAIIVGGVTKFISMNERIARLEERLSIYNENSKFSQPDNNSTVNTSSTKVNDPSKLLDLIKSQQLQNVKPSYNDNNCFTEKDLITFKKNKTYEQIVNDLMSNNAFIDIVIAIKKMQPTERQNLINSASKVAKKTWQQLGKQTPEGQTDAGNQAELLISFAIVNKVNEMMKFSIIELNKLYK